MKRQMRKGQQGFTLIELMIVVAIIGILAAIAIPQYRDYVTRSKWSAAVTAVGQLKTAVSTCVNTNDGDLTKCNKDSMITSGDLPANWDYPDLTKNGIAQNGMSVSNGVITITGAAELGNCVLTLTPTPNTNALAWSIISSGDDKCTKSKTGFATST